MAITPETTSKCVQCVAKQYYNGWHIFR